MSMRIWIEEGDTMRVVSLREAKKEIERSMLLREALYQGLREQVDRFESGRADPQRGMHPAREADESD